MQVHLDGEVHDVAHPPTGKLRHERTTSRFPPEAPPGDRTIRLGDRCGARSGDKGGHANVGLWVRDPAHYGWLLRTVTAERVQAWLAADGFEGRVERYELDSLQSVNFMLYGWLDRGVASNLAPDPQAKCLGEFFRTKHVPAD